jgi:hypothetical protein
LQSVKHCDIVRVSKRAQAAQKGATKMIDEKRILAEGTVMAARCGTVESATDFILQHDKTVEKFAKIEVLESLLDDYTSNGCNQIEYVSLIEVYIDRLKAGN